MTGKKRGRPCGVVGLRKKNRTFRITEDIETKLVVAASARGWSVSDEIQSRLLQSFDHQDISSVVRGMFGPQYRYAPHHHSPGAP